MICLPLKMVKGVLRGCSSCLQLQNWKELRPKMDEVLGTRSVMLKKKLV